MEFDKSFIFFAVQFVSIIDTRYSSNIFKVEWKFLHKICYLFHQFFEPQYIYISYETLKYITVTLLLLFTFGSVYLYY